MSYSSTNIMNTMNTNTQMHDCGLDRNHSLASAEPCSSFLHHRWVRYNVAIAGQDPRYRPIVADQPVDEATAPTEYHESSCQL